MKRKLGKFHSVDMLDYERNSEMNSMDEDSDSTSSDDEVPDIKTTRIEQRERRRNDTERLSRTAFVGNLPAQITKTRLLRIFRRALRTDPVAVKSNCSVESVRLRGAVPVTGGTSRQARKRASIQHEFAAGDQHTLVGFVVLSSKIGIPTVLKLNGLWVSNVPNTVSDVPVNVHENGRHIRVDVCTRNSSTHDSQKSIFIGNLPFSANEEQIREAFQKYGQICNVRLVRDSMTAAVKGIGFVEFTDASAVSFALRASETVQIGNRVLRIQPCKKIKKVKMNKHNQQPVRHGKSGLSVGPPTRRLKVVVPTNLRGVDRSKFVKRFFQKRQKRKKSAENSENPSKFRRSLTNKSTENSSKPARLRKTSNSKTVNLKQSDKKRQKFTSQKS